MAPESNIDKEIALYEGWKRICADLPHTVAGLQITIDNLKARKEQIRLRKEAIDAENAAPKPPAIS